MRDEVRPEVSPAARRKSLSSIIAEVLTGSWRFSPPDSRFSAEELETVVRPLSGSGAAALAWWKIRLSHLRESAPGVSLRQFYQSQSLQSALQEPEVEHVFSLLRSAGVEPILLKGSAAARLYAEPGLRPPGDIDICVRPEQYEAASEAVWGPGRKGTALVDLHHDASALLDRGGWDGLYDRSRLITLNESKIRVLGHEDLLRFLCLHLLRHSAYRPLWLCDISAAFESAPTTFDWDVALGDDALKRNWVTSVLYLARRLLGARREDLPEEVSAASAPAWLVEEVLRQWERPSTADHIPRELMAVSLRHPSRALPALLGRWPDPIEAAVGLRMPFADGLRLPSQLAFYLVRSANFLKRPVRRARGAEVARVVSD
jgi:Uncharacterised nucleotidyltransferase